MNNYTLSQQDMVTAVDLWPDAQRQALLLRYHFIIDTMAILIPNAYAMAYNEMIHQQHTLF